ncbi:helix-turn-helix domain-containing protein [Streptomyces globisporus]|uniref:helix-turn-helix domain-containing protein n=1 Tax=Streptomyces globisporus TaxID=1908 RepID=UPI00346155BC|nr:helix-turn-helix domain-containing protein [Streptomyces globisporus]
MTAALTYPEAAKELGVTETWLRRHIKRLPHAKKGRTVTFSAADIERIEQLHHVEPGPLVAPQSPAGSHPLAELKPLPSRGRRQRIS